MIARFQYLILAFILALGFAVRLYKIDNPIADWHSWRQADTSSVTRNFVKHGIDLLRPRYDNLSYVSDSGIYNPQGYRFVEFPLFNLAHYTLYSLISNFYSLEFAGRMTSILASLVSAGLLFTITRRHASVFAALLAAAVYLFLPYNIYFTRVVLPDPLMVTLLLAALNFSDLYFTTSKFRYLVFSAFFGGLATLVKPTALFFLLPAAWQFWQKFKLRVFRHSHFWFFQLALFLPFFLWRSWSHRFPEGIPSSLWLLNGNGIRFRPAFFRWIFGERIGKMILGSWGLLPFSLGLASVGYFAPWVIAALLYLFTFATGNVQHDYYQIPVIPIVSILVALGAVHFSSTWPKRFLVAVSLIFMVAFAWYDIKGNYQVNHWEIVHAGAAADRLLPADAIVIAPYGFDTALLYQINRRGFPAVTLPIKDFKDRYGAMYYVSVNFDDQTTAVMTKYTVLAQTPEYVIVKLDEPIRP